MRSHQTIHELGAAQLGLVTYEQLRSAGVTRDVIRGLRARGAVVELRPHVYAVAGAPKSREQTVLAAVLAAGKTAFASHETAAQLLGLPLPTPARLEVTTLYERCPRLEGVRLHRSGLLDERDVTMLGAIPVATATRIVVDLSSRLSIRDLGRLTDEALRLRMTSLGRIQATAQRLRRAPGRSPRNVATMLALRVADTEQRESVLEDFVYAALLRFGLPLPVPQYRVVLNGRERRIDLCYPDRWLALEAKGFEFRRSRAGFDGDALRDNELQLAGFRVLSFTAAFTDLQIAQQVASALRLAAPRPRPPLTFAEWKALR